MEYVWTTIIGTNMGFTVLTCARTGTTGRFVMGYMYLYRYRYISYHMEVYWTMTMINKMIYQEQYKISADSEGDRSNW